jgi:hypothetical protein
LPKSYSFLELVSVALYEVVPAAAVLLCIKVMVPGGNETYGIDIYDGASYDVHGAVQVMFTMQLR